VESGGRRLNLVQQLSIPILFGLTFWRLIIFRINLQNVSIYKKKKQEIKHIYDYSMKTGLDAMNTSHNTSVVW